MILIKESKKRRILEKITKVDLEKWRKDFSYFTKDIRRISNGKDFFEVFDALKRWVKEFDKLVFSKIKNADDYNSQNVNFEASWKATLGLKRFFESLYLGFNDYYMNEEFPSYYTTYYEEAYDRIYKLFDKKRSTIYVQFSQMGKKAFDELDFYLDSIGGEAIDHSIEEDYNYKGIGITFTYAENNEEKAEELKKDFLKSLQLSIDILKQKRLDWFLRKVKFVIHLSKYKSDRAGEYNNANQEIVLFENDLNDKNLFFIILHELGHFVEAQIITKSLQKEWQSFYDNIGFKHISSDVKNNIRKEIEKILKDPKFIEVVHMHDKKEINDYQYSVIGLKYLLDKFDPTTSEYALVDTLLSQHNRQDKIDFSFPHFSFLEWRKNNYNDVAMEQFIKYSLERGSGLIYQDRLLINKISPYGAQNELEGFAELFYLYVTDEYKNHGVSKTTADFMGNLLADFKR